MSEWQIAAGIPFGMLVVAAGLYVAKIPVAAINNSDKFHVVAGGIAGLLICSAAVVGGGFLTLLSVHLLIFS